MLGAKPPFHVPLWLARMAAGEHLTVMMTEQRAGSNAKAKRDLGWSPRYSSWRQGLRKSFSARSRSKVHSQQASIRRPDGGRRQGQRYDRGVSADAKQRSVTIRLANTNFDDA